MNNNNFSEIISLLKSKKLSPLFSGETENTIIQFFRYCFVGGVATIVDWGLSTLLFYFAFGGSSFASLSNAIGFVAGLLLNYFLSTFWIFKKSKINNKFIEFLSFAAIGVVGLLMTVGITQLFEMTLRDTTSAYQILGKVISTAAAFLWNFFARKYLIFSKKDKSKRSAE